MLVSLVVELLGSMCLKLIKKKNGAIVELLSTPWFYVLQQT
jgi:hypothetical protein